MADLLDELLRRGLHEEGALQYQEDAAALAESLADAADHLSAARIFVVSQASVYDGRVVLSWTPRELLDSEADQELPSLEFVRAARNPHANPARRWRRTSSRRGDRSFPRPFTLLLEINEVEGPFALDRGKDGTERSQLPPCYAGVAAQLFPLLLDDIVANMLATRRLRGALEVREAVRQSTPRPAR